MLAIDRASLGKRQPHRAGACLVAHKLRQHLAQQDLELPVCLVRPHKPYVFTSIGEEFVFSGFFPSSGVTGTGVEIKPNFPLARGMSSPEKLLVPKKNH